MEGNIKVATRESYGNALRECGKIYNNLVVLDADLAVATKTDIFKKEFPERHINCGIAEANMMGVAAGLSLSGKIPFVSSFAMFAAGRAFEQIRNTIGYPHLNVKIGATHGGISVGEDGATHQCNEDFALMRTIPGMVVMCPSDDIEARAMVKAAIEYKGPVYIRFGRSPVSIINESKLKFEIGKATCLKAGKDITIVANGICVSTVLEVAKELDRKGISAEVLNFSTIKPLDEEMLIKSVSKTKKVVTVEEHSIIGGLGGAVCEYLSNKLPVPILRVGVNDTYGESGKVDELLKKYKLDFDGVYYQIEEFLKSFKGED